MKYYHLLLLSVPALIATSCSSEDVPAPSKGDMTSFTVIMPEGMTTRFGEGTTAKNLAVAVFDENDNLLYSSVEGEGEAMPEGASVGNFQNGLTTTVTLPLVKGKAYNIAFWAYADNSPYTFSPSEKKITVDYAGAKANDETRDAFFNYYKLAASNMSQNNVELRRPFAQVNIGTSDIETATVAGMTATSANITFPAGALASSFNFTTGTADTPNTEEVIFTGTSIPSDNFPIQPETYKYLAMAYILSPVADVAQPKSVITSVALTVNDKNFGAFDNIPVQGNYRTNIFGALLTNPEKFNVTIQPAFTGSYIEEQPVQTIDSTDPDEILAAINKGGNFVLTSDIENLDLTSLNRTATTKITIKGNVGSLNPGTTVENPANLIISVPKDVAYPQFISNKNSNWENITIEGDLSSTKRCPGIIFYNTGIKKIDGLTVNGVPFEGQGVNFGYTANPSVVQNVKVVGCDFINMMKPFVNGGNNLYANTIQGDIEIINNHVVFADNADKNSNGIYLAQSTGNILIENNTIENAPYHGITLSPATSSKNEAGIMPSDAVNANVIVRDNTIISPKRDGIKIDSPYGNVVISGNKVMTAGNYGIRFMRFNGAWTPTITISNNTISTKYNFFNGIYLNKESGYNGTAVINVFGNVGVGKNSKWFYMSLTPAEGSNYSNPFVN